jgi:hypothetical protein
MLSEKGKGRSEKESNGVPLVLPEFWLHHGCKDSEAAIRFH